MPHVHAAPTARNPLLSSGNPTAADRVRHWFSLGHTALVLARAAMLLPGDAAARLAAFLLTNVVEYFIGAIVVLGKASNGVAPSSERRAELRFATGAATITSSAHHLPYLRAIALEVCPGAQEALALPSAGDVERFGRLSRAYARARYSFGPPPLSALDLEILVLFAEGLRSFVEPRLGAMGAADVQT